MKKAFFNFQQGHTLVLIVVLFFILLFASCSGNNDGDKFLGKWTGFCKTEITKNGDYYQWKDNGGCFGTMQLKCVNGELQSGGMMGNVAFSNGSIFVMGHELTKVQ